MVSFFILVNYKQSVTCSQPQSTCSKTIIEIPEKCVKSVQSTQERLQNNNDVYWCLNCYLQTYFSQFTSVSIVDVEQQISAGVISS